MKGELSIGKVAEVRRASLVAEEARPVGTKA
jgi:hypothetical protein